MGFFSAQKSHCFSGLLLCAFELRFYDQSQISNYQPLNQHVPPTYQRTDNFIKVMGWYALLRHAVAVPDGYGIIL